jgi:phospholipase/carboxylesterase
VPLAQPPKSDLARKPVLITSGQRDPIIPASNAAELAGQLTHNGANVQHSVLPTGHELTQMDATLAKEWIKIALLPEAVTSTE